MTSTASSKDLCMGLLTVRLAQLQLDVGLSLGTLLLVAGIGGDLVNVNDKSGHGLLICWWQRKKIVKKRMRSDNVALVAAFIAGENSRGIRD